MDWKYKNRDWKNKTRNTGIYKHGLEIQKQGLEIHKHGLEIQKLGLEIQNQKHWKYQNMDWKYKTGTRNAKTQSKKKNNYEICHNLLLRNIKCLTRNFQYLYFSPLPPGKIQVLYTKVTAFHTGITSYTQTGSSNFFLWFVSSLILVERFETVQARKWIVFLNVWETSQDIS